MKPKNQPNETKSTREFKAQQKEEWNEHIASLREQGLLRDKIYIQRNEAKDAYNYVLDTGEKALPALKYAADKNNKDKNWVDEVKTSPIGKQLLSTIMRDLSEHPTSQMMEEYSLNKTGNKRSLKEAKSINSVLNTLSDQVNIAHRLKFLENKVDYLETVMLVLTEQVADNTQRLESVEYDVSNLTKLQLKEEAKRLSKKGLTQREISDKLHKSQKTISNWLKEED